MVCVPHSLLHIHILPLPCVNRTVFSCSSVPLSFVVVVRSYLDDVLLSPTDPRDPGIHPLEQSYIPQDLCVADDGWGKGNEKRRSLPFCCTLEEQEAGDSSEWEK